MKRHQFFLTLLSAGTVALTSFTTGYAQRDDRQTPYQTKTFSGNINAVRAETSGGSLTIEGGSGNQAKVEMYVRPNNWNSRDNVDKAEIEERLKDYEITIAQEGGTLVATARRRNNNDNDWKRSLSISLSALNGRQRFRTSGGSLHLTDVAGDINGQTSGGSIHLDRCRQAGTENQINLQTSGGSIQASASSGDMRLHTSGGSIELDDLKGDIDAQTSGGSVRGGNLEGDIKASTSGGSVRLANVAGSIDASTSAGSVEVSLTKLGQYVRLNTSVGSIRVKMPMDKGMDLNLSGNRVEVGTLSKFDGDIEKDRVRGKLNGGGVAVNISAGNGSVYINR
jgi:DUF4097 and DUF4098 domain-containing protein YvlB